ncbi:YdeI/OmpD-associated family protein [Rhizobium panacihumi]|uniref:YdeI/OmpD-associated family protein n=1 Tax=Rhizobium panacihumi TaxID=2008450 RepID=UPI003D7B9784
MTETKSGLPILSFSDAKALEDWIGVNPVAPGLWIKFAKKKAGLARFDKEQALDVALCHGWIDGQAASYNADHFLMRFTPRRARSLWSQVNLLRIEKLTAEGRMRPAGIAQVDAAKADGRWEAAYAPPSQIGIPEDLAAALAENVNARTGFEALGKSKRYMLLHAIVTVKKRDTRARKIAALVLSLSSPATH